MTTAEQIPHTRSPSDPCRSAKAGLLLGIGLMAAVDEIVFHQLLAWHHFYDRSTPLIGLFSDGILHSAEVICLVAGFFLLAEVQGRRAIVRATAWAWLLVGAGGFQLFDGLIDHKVLRLHQIRYVENLWPYDLAWNGFAVLLLGIGVILTRQVRADEQRRRA